MLTAIALISADTALIPEVAQTVADIEGVSEVYSVTGNVDLIAIVRVNHHEELAQVIADRIGKVNGVVSSQTYIAFQAYSKHDLATAFNLGLD